jgi:hypothetical protein
MLLHQALDSGEVFAKVTGLAHREKKDKMKKKVG